MESGRTNNIHSDGATTGSKGAIGNLQICRLGERSFNLDGYIGLGVYTIALLNAEVCIELYFRHSKRSFRAER